MSLFSDISQSLASVDWTKDFEVYTTPFRENWFNLLLASMVWFGIHAASTVICKSNGAFDRVVSNLKEADKAKNKVRSEKYYAHRANFDLNTKVTALCHAVVASSFSIYALATYSLDMMNVETIYETSPLWSFVCTLSAGYFFYDFVVAIWDMDPQYLIHGGFSFAIYGHASFPFMAHVGGLFLCYEISAIFLNLRWLLIQAGKGSSAIFNYVETAFAGFFILIRLGWGNWFATFYMHPLLFKMFFLGHPTAPHSRIASAIFSLANIAIQILNTYWASLIFGVLSRSLGRSKKSSKAISSTTSETTPAVEKKRSNKPKSKSA